MTTTSTAAAAFKWAEILEREFDKNFLELDVDEKTEKALSGLGSCFAQAIHKAQTVFQANAKQEAELLHLREELAEAKATEDKLEAEKKYLVCRLQTALLENHKLRHNDVDAANVNVHDVGRRLAEELEAVEKEKVDWNARKVEERAKRLAVENAALRKTQVELEGELVGARLDAKYLDKELAGRIQQIQILLAGGGTSHERKQRVWSHIEAEMRLQRSKTISNMCYSKQKVKEAGNERCSNNDNSDSASSRKSSLNNSVSGSVKQVHVHKSDAEELGMAILGGREHGLPVMISEVFPNTAVGRSRKICAGDVILAVNGDSFEGLGHHEAVKYLSALRGAIRFDLESRVDDTEIDGVCDMTRRFYDVFDPSATSRSPTAFPGTAKDISGSSATSTAQDEDESRPELPQVHSSPKKSHYDNGSAKR